LAPSLPGDLGYISDSVQSLPVGRTLLSLFKQFVALAFLRIKPQDLPSHPMALQVSVFAALSISTISLIASYSLPGAFLRSVLAMLLSAAFLYGVLSIQQRQQRFNQAFTAICGASIVIYIVAIPLFPSLGASTGNISGMVLTLVLLLDIWSLIVTAYVYQHTFEVPFARGIALALLLMFLTLLVFGLFPGPAPPDFSTGS
jgi:hypothetical protein